MGLLVSIAIIFILVFAVVFMKARGRDDELQKYVSETIKEEFSGNILQSEKLVYDNFECFWYYIKGISKFGFVSIDTKKVFSYSDIIYLAIDIDGNTEISKTKTNGAIIGAVAGGLLFGGIGAVVGSSANKKYTTTTKKTHNAMISIGLKDSKFINIRLSDIPNHVLPGVRECYNFLAAKYAMNDLSQEKSIIESKDDTKVCPFCAETIKKAALVCRYCGKELPVITGTEHLQIATTRQP